MADISINKQTQIVYEVTDQGDTFRDAIYSPIDNPLTNEEIATEIQTRYNNHIQSVDSVNTPIEASEVIDALGG